MASKHTDLVEFTKKYKSNLHGFFVDMKSWGTFKTTPRLKWLKVQFLESRRSDVPQQRGIYVFTAEAQSSQLPQHGYILYMGITGDKSGATLRSRFGQYLRHLKNENGRPAILYMLLNWEESLAFNFVPLPDKKVDLAKIEKNFLKAIMPPVNRRDFDAQVTAIRQAEF